MYSNWLSSLKNVTEKEVPKLKPKPAPKVVTTTEPEPKLDIPTRVEEIADVIGNQEFSQFDQICWPVQLS